MRDGTLIAGTGSAPVPPALDRHVTDELRRRGRP
jgi:hypothetical protein